MDLSKIPSEIIVHDGDYPDDVEIPKFCVILPRSGAGAWVGGLSALIPTDRNPPVKLTPP